MPHQITTTLALVAVTTIAAESADDFKLPTGYRTWFHVNTMVVDKASPLFEGLGGMHNVYANVRPRSRRAAPIPTAASSSLTCTISLSPRARMSRVRARAWPQ
jgi:hypothetical protein